MCRHYRLDPQQDADVDVDVENQPGGQGTMTIVIICRAGSAHFMHGTLAA